MADADDLVAEPLVTELSERGETLALAESCTGGLAASLVTDVPGASEVLDRSIVAYTVRAKREELGVDASLLEDQGPVSQPVAAAMARGVRQAASTTWAVSATGFAGPTGGTDQAPVGTVFVGVAGPDGVDVERYVFEGDRDRIKARTAEQAIEDLLSRVET